jgi:hypothetical protein
VPNKKWTDEGRLIDLEKASDEECEKAAEQQENHDEHVSQWRREISRQLTFRDGFDIRKCVHWDGNR